MKRAQFQSTQIVFGLALLLAAGCGVFTTRKPDFPNAETGENGEVYVLEDLRDIANDPDLTDDEKRQAFRDLGIEDEDVIDGLLTL
jgi:hypothetical protein